MAIGFWRPRIVGIAALEAFTQIASDVICFEFGERLLTAIRYLATRYALFEDGFVCLCCVNSQVSWNRFLEVSNDGVFEWPQAPIQPTTNFGGAYIWTQAQS